MFLLESNNSEQALGIVLKLYFSVVKILKLKFRKFWGQIPTFVKVIEEKLVGWSFYPSAILNRVKITPFYLRWFGDKTNKCLWSFPQIEFLGNQWEISQAYHWYLWFRHIHIDTSHLVEKVIKTESLY